jgi:hypothetical protein
MSKIAGMNQNDRHMPEELNDSVNRKNCNDLDMKSNEGYKTTSRPLMPILNLF